MLTFIVVTFRAATIYNDTDIMLIGSLSAYFQRQFIQNTRNPQQKNSFEDVGKMASFLPQDQRVK